MQVASPFIVKARGEEPIKIGLNDPFTGTYAELGKNEQIGCQLAIDEINAKGGILGRQVELLSEDSTSADTGTAVQKAHKLIERDKVDFLLGNVNSAMAIALGEVSNAGRRPAYRHRRPHRRGHRHAIATGTCSASATRRAWRPIRSRRRCSRNTARNGISSRPTTPSATRLQQGFEASLKKFGGTEVGASLTPLGTTDYSSYLIKAQAANPDVIIFLQAGQDAVNALKQAVQFGLDKRFHIAGAQQELEVLERACRPRRASAPGCSNGIGTSRTCRTSPSSSPRSASVTAARCRRRGIGSATSRRGPARLSPTSKKTLDAVKLAKALEGLQAAAGDRADAEQDLLPRRRPPADADALCRPRGRARAPDPEDLFVVDQVVKGVEAALPVAETGCHVKWPA